MEKGILPNTLAESHIVIRELLVIIEKQSFQIEDLSSKYASLNARMGQNSINSSRPSSSNFGQNSPKIARTPIKPGLPKEGKKLGGQESHIGKTLESSSTPDEIVKCGTEICGCGRKLSTENSEIVKICQVYDLPQPKLYVTEYQQLRQECNCGCVHIGQLPLEVTASVQYGSGVRALTSILTTSCQLSLKKTSQLFADLYGSSLNESTSCTNNELLYTHLETTENQIKAKLLDSEVVNYDETGISISKALYWLHTACNELYTHLFVSPKRGKEAHENGVSILPSFKNWAIHDCYSTYFNYTEAKHGICNAHILRELQFQIEQGKVWGTQIHAFLIDLYKRSERATLVLDDIEALKLEWKNRCLEAILFEENLLAKSMPSFTPTLFELKTTKKGRKKRGKALSLLDRLLLNTDAILAFAQYNFVPFSNNQAERDVRPVKTKLKVAGCFRTINGADYYARIQGFIATCRKNSLNVFDQIKKVFLLQADYVAPFG